jgi:hypothetical protein
MRCEWCSSATTTTRSPTWTRASCTGPGRGVPDGQRWYPVVTFLQTMIDAANAMRNEPGQFRSTGHDYRADTARFVAEGYRLPYTEDQMSAVEVELRRLEKERAARIKPPADATDGAAPVEATATGSAPSRNGDGSTEQPLPIRAARTSGPDWIGKSGLSG